jgi:ABC-type nickel/cobalt efflux system permease component RcnA
MSLTALTPPGTGLPLRRLAIMAVSLAAIFGLLALIAWALGSNAAPPPPPRSPFGVGVRETAPAATGIGGMILAWQSSFYSQMSGALKAPKDNGAALIGLLGLGFAYGVFHAAGPGHGKAVIAAWIVAEDRSLKRGLGLSLAAALLQAIVAIAVVLTLRLALNATAATMGQTTRLIEIASFAAVGALGLSALWRKAGSLAAHLGGGSAPACDHVHLPGPEALDRLDSWRAMAGVVLAAGLRPCSGAILILVFALAQGLLWAGIAATFAMALGTALTTGALAAFAVWFKLGALRLAGGRGGSFGSRLILGLECLAAGFVAVLGLTLLFGIWTGAGQS